MESLCLKICQSLVIFRSIKMGFYFFSPSVASSLFLSFHGFQQVDCETINHAALITMKIIVRP